MWNFNKLCKEMWDDARMVVGRAFDYTSTYQQALLTLGDMRMKMRDGMSCSAEFHSLTKVLRYLDQGEANWVPRAALPWAPSSRDIRRI